MSGLTPSIPDLRAFVSVLDFQAVGNGATDDLPALLRAKAAATRLHFPRIANKPTTYFLGAFNAGDLDGLTLRADDGVTLSFPSNSPYTLFKNVKFAGDVRVYLRDIQRTVTFAKSPDATRRETLSIAPAAIRRRRIAVDMNDAAQVSYRYVAWPTSDNFVDLAGVTKASNSATIPAGGGNRFNGPFIGIGVYETVSAQFDNGLTPGPIGVVIRGTTGYAVIYGATTGGDLAQGRKLTGQAQTETALPWTPLGEGSYATFAPDKSVWSVTRVDRTKAVVKLNGRAVTAPYAIDVGDIFEVGFCCYTGAQFTVSAPTVERRTDAAVGMPELDEIRIFGDSTAERYPGSWDQYLQPVLAGHYGIRLKGVANYAVAGQDLGQQYTAMQNNGLGNAYHVVVCCGTNNVQGLQPIEDYKALVTNVIQYITTRGRRPVIVLPWFWYGKAQAPDGQGQNAVNYDKGAPYRQWLERIAYENGAIVVRTGEELPVPAPSLVTSDPLAPYLRDNIHQDQLAHQLYAAAICKAIIDDYQAMPDTVEEQPAAAMLQNGTTAGTDLRFIYGKAGQVTLTGTATITQTANNTVILKLPRHLLPTTDVTVPCITLAADGVTTATCWIGILSNGNIVLQGVAGTATKIIINASYKLRAAP